MADIRRETQDVNPNTYVRSGVQDTSASTIVGGLAEGGMQIDSTLAKRRLAKAADMLNAQYVVGSPAADLQDEESATDSTPLSPEDDRQLKDFAGVLNTNQKARDQGKMNFDTYTLRGERLLRIAIAKRPGLAQEFRQIAAQHLGTDVLGAEVGFLKSQEDALAKGAAAAAKKADDDKWKIYNDQIDLLKNNGFAGYGAFQGPDDPQYQEYYRQVFPALQKKVAAASALKMAQQNVELTKTQKEANADAQNQAWSAGAENLLATFPGTVENARLHLQQRGLSNDPAAIREVANTVLTGLNDEIQKLNVAGANNTVSPEVYQGYMQRLDGMRKQAEAVISGSSDKDLVTNWTNLTSAQAKAALYTNEEYVRTSVLLNDLPDTVASQITAKMEKRLILNVSDLLQETGSPTEQARLAGATVQQMMVSIVPDGSGTPPDAVAVGRMATAFTNSAVAFLTQPQGDFRADQFTRNPHTNAAGFLANLDNHMVTLKKVLPDDRKQELASSVAAAAGNATRILAGNLYTKAPSLKGKIQANYNNAAGNLFELKPGIAPESLNVMERSQLRAANQSAQLPLVLKVLKGLTGADQAGAVKLLGTAYQPGQQAVQAAVRGSTARTAPRSGGSSSQGGNRRSGPAVGSVDSGFRFKGGDPSDQANWEPVE